MTEPVTLELLGRPPSGKAVVRMTPKGHSPVDLDSAAPATSRRGLIGALGAAGLAGAAALVVARPASAAPNSPTDSDKELLRAAMELELTARDLYNVSIDAGLSDVALELATVFASNHALYADKIAGTAGFSANTRNDEVFDQLESAFATSNVDAFTEAAATLENTAVATHSSIMSDYESVDARSLTAAIVVVEARMATVLTDLGGLASNLDDLFEPTAEPLDLAAGATS
jgi:Ferritin-like domain